MLALVLRAEPLSQSHPGEVHAKDTQLHARVSLGHPSLQVGVVPDLQQPRLRMHRLVWRSSPPYPHVLICVWSVCL